MLHPYSLLRPAFFASAHRRLAATASLALHAGLISRGRRCRPVSGVVALERSALPRRASSGNACKISARSRSISASLAFAPSRAQFSLTSSRVMCPLTPVGSRTQSHPC